MEEENGLIKAVEKEIFDHSLDLGIEYAELGLDAMMTTGVLKEIPLVKSLYSAYSIYNSVTDRFRIKKILTFLKQLSSKTIEPQKLEKFKRSFKDEKYRDEVLEMVVLLNERFLHIEKSKILANFFRCLIEEKITYSDFIHLSSILDAIQIRGLTYLKNWGDLSRDFVQLRDLDSEGIPLLLAAGIGYTHGSGIRINDMGRNFFRFAFT